jgi:hypothetical protein
MISLGNKTLFTWIINTQKGVGFYSKIWPFPSHMALNHPDDVCYFQDASEDNGIHVPFTIGIQTPFQLQTMVSSGDNGTISMDVTFNIDGV